MEPASSIGASSGNQRAGTNISMVGANILMAGANFLGTNILMVGANILDTNISMAGTKFQWLVQTFQPLAFLQMTSYPVKRLCYQAREEVLTKGPCSSMPASRSQNLFAAHKFTSVLRTSLFAGQSSS